MSKSNQEVEGDVLLAARDRWAKDARLRKMHGCLTSNPDDAQYVQRMNRYARAVAKNFSDNLPSARAFDEIRGRDVCAEALANPNLIAHE